MCFFKFVLKYRKLNRSIVLNAYDCKKKKKRAVHSAVQLFIWVHSVFRSFVSITSKRSVDRLFINSAIRLNPLAHLVIPSLVLPLACSFAFLVCSVAPPFTLLTLLFKGINML